jgi:SAM-dependent methyltransferase
MTALVAASGHRFPLAVGRWRGEVDDAEWAQLSRLPSPILDVGCGPGRVAAALAVAGRPALGIDTAPAAIAEAATRGAAVLQRSVFAALPGEGRWGGAVLLDGNVGIGGDPVALLRRVASLLRPAGVVLVEVEPPGQPTERLAVRIESGRRWASPWFPWARVAADGFAALAVEAGLEPAGCTVADDRWFATATRP